MSIAAPAVPEAVSDAGLVLQKIRGLVYSTRSVGFRALRLHVGQNTGTQFQSVKQADAIFRKASVFLDARDLCTLSRVYGNGDKFDKVLDLNAVLADLIPPAQIPPNDEEANIPDARRKNLVAKVWKDCTGAFKSSAIDLIDFVGATNPAAFPHVKAGRLDHDECRQLLMVELESIMAMTGKSMVDGGVFAQYGTEVSCLCALDGQFQNCMGMFSKKTELFDDKKMREMALVDLFVRKFREMRDHRAVYMLFQYYDPEGRMALPFKEFEEMCIHMSINISDAEKRLIFDFFGPAGVIVGGPFLKYIFYCMDYASVELGRPADYQQVKEAGPAAHDPDAEPRQLCEKIRKHLIKYHPRGLSVIFNTLHTLNRVGAKIPKDQFAWGLNVCGLRLGTAESDYLEYFFSSGTDFVDKDEFLDYLRGDLALYASRKAEAQKRIDLVGPGPGEYTDSDYKLKKWEPAFGVGEYLAAQFILDQYNVAGHPMKEEVGPEKLTKEFFDYLGESLAIGQALKAKVVKYIVDEGLSLTDEQWRTYLYSCLPSRNPEENVVPEAGA